jgi:phosphatidylinositol alpha-1,6-mannosyltransferase
LVALYHRSDVFALPARTVLTGLEAKGEGFGIVFLEAMAFGKPVIGPNYGAPAELIRDGENGLLVDPDSVTSVAGALVELLTNPEKGRELGKAGRESVRTVYSYGSFCERLRGLLPSSPNDVTVVAPQPPPQLGQEANGFGEIIDSPVTPRGTPSETRPCQAEEHKP